MKKKTMEAYPYLKGKKKRTHLNKLVQNNEPRYHIECLIEKLHSSSY